MSPAGIGAIVVGAGALYVALEKFRKTSFGVNGWTVDGILGAALIMLHVENVANLIGADWHSVYRSPEIQRALYESKRKDPVKWAVVESSAKKAGLSTEAYVAKLSTGSRHSRGLAADFTARGLAMDALADRIYGLAKAGRIGKVKKVLNERDHVHVEWWAPWEQPKPTILESV